jgi:hypothetical protein
MTDLQRSMQATFRSLRVTVGVLGVLFPLILWADGVREKISLRGTMSAYYHASKECGITYGERQQCQQDPANCKHPVADESTCIVGGGPLRNVFVGFLFVIGTCLFLYRGFSKWEDWALSVGGVCGVLVALCPMAWNEYPPLSSKFHYPSAIVFFACMFFVCAFCSERTLRLPGVSATARNRYRFWYIVIALLMLASPVTAGFFNRVTRQDSTVFWTEAFGVWAFGAFWLLKTHELWFTKVEARAINGELSLNRDTLMGPEPREFHAPEGMKS